MPRGAKKGGNNSPVIGDTGITATKADLQRLSIQALNSFLASTGTAAVDLHSAESVQAAIVAYFQRCIDTGTRPGNLGLYAALGMSKQDYHDVVNGRNKSKASPAAIDLMKSAVRAIGAYREGLALEGKINPVTYIFMGKNYDNLSDVQQVEISASAGQTAELSPEEIAARIEKEIPIDADFKENA